MKQEIDSFSCSSIKARRAGATGIGETKYRHYNFTALLANIYVNYHPKIDNWGHQQAIKFYKNTFGGGRVRRRRLVGRSALSICQIHIINCLFRFAAVPGQLGGVLPRAGAGASDHPCSSSQHPLQPAQLLLRPTSVLQQRSHPRPEQSSAIGE